jgi:hypothetical protein
MLYGIHRRQIAMGFIIHGNILVGHGIVQLKKFQQRQMKDLLQELLLMILIISMLHGLMMMITMIVVMIKIYILNQINFFIHGQ